MTPYAATTPLESPQRLSQEDTGSGAKHSRTSRARTGRKVRSQPVDGQTESGNSQSPEADPDGGAGTHSPVVSSGAGEHIRSILTDSAAVWDDVSIEARPLLTKFLSARSEASAIARLEVFVAVNKCLPWAMRCKYTKGQAEWFEEKIQHPVRVAQPLFRRKLTSADTAISELLIFYREVWRRFEDWQRKQPAETEAAPTHEPEEEVAPSPKLKVGDRVQFHEFCFGESRLVTGEIKERPTPFGTSLCAEAAVKLPPIEQIEEQYHEIYPADGIHRSTVIVNQWLLKHCTVIAPATPESILTKYGFIDSTNLSDPSDIVEVYRGWGIALSIPNGGVLAVDILKGEQSWGKPTEEEFGYESEPILQHAKQVIDEIEAAIATSQPPQMSIPGIEEVQEEGAIAPTPQPDALDELITDLKGEIEPTPAVIMMSAAEARSCVDSIKGHIENARKLLLDLYEREGWKSLGYSSWRECAAAEFGESKSQLYRELEAAKIERNISPIGEIGQIRESHLRPLTKLEPEQQREVWEEAVTTAPNGKVTAAHVQEVAEKHLPPVQEEIPSLEELFKFYGQIAERVEHRPTHKYRNQFAVERTAHPAFSFYPLGRREAWQAWQRKYRRYLEISPLPPEKQMLHPGYPLSEPKPVVEVFPVQQSCKTCQHRHLTGDGSEFTCGTKGDKWACAVTRDWAQENNGCDKFKPPSLQMVTVQPPVDDKAEEAATPVEAEPERRIPIYAFDLTTSQYNKLAVHAKAAGTSMVGYLQKLVEELPEAH